MTVFSNDIQFTTDSVGSFNSPLWRFFIAALDGTGIVDYSKLAAGRACEPVLNAPLSLTGTVPSDNILVWLPSDADDFKDPYLAEGTRLLWGFRRESSVPPYYVVRAATLVQLVEDAAEQDDARTRFVGYDPWRYLFARPVCDADGNLPGPEGMNFPEGTEVNEVVGTLLANTIINQGHTYIDAGATYIGTGFYTGNILDTGNTLPEGGFTIPQGTSVGQAWQMLTDANLCDIVLEPIYDPRNRPNYLCQLNVYPQAGVTRDEQVFAWDRPGRSLTGLNRLQDGGQRANVIRFYAGQGGAQGFRDAFDSASVDKYGDYWAQQFFPGQNIPAVVESLAERQLSLRKNGKTTVTFKPAPERSPRPWQDYQLGDRVPVWAGREKFRLGLGGEQPAILSASVFGWFVVAGNLSTMFPPGTAFTALNAGANTGGPWVVDSVTFDGDDTLITTTVAPAVEGAGGVLVVPQYQRIYGWTASISDDALETIDPVLTSPGGFSS